MIFQALLILKDDNSAELLSRILADFQVDSEHCPDAQAAAQKLNSKHFDAVVLDLDDDSAASVLRDLRQSSASKSAVSITLLNDPAEVRRAFGMGANFVLYKPLSSATASSSLRAAIALLKRERRRTFRVPVQLPVTLSWKDASEVEGIMLDLSEDGMDVLSAQPMSRGQLVNVHFSLPDLSQIAAVGNVAWANSNGQAGVEFINFPDNQRHVVQQWLLANAPEAPPPDPEPLSNCRLSDLSLGGCYIETESPFPISTEVALVLRAGEMSIQVAGLVRVMHPAFGMGLELTSENHQQQIEQFISVLSGQPGSVPQLEIIPKAIRFQPDMTAQANHCDDSLVELLRSDAPLSQEEFVAELRKQRGSAAEAANA